MVPAHQCHHRGVEDSGAAKLSVIGQHAQKREIVAGGRAKPAKEFPSNWLLWRLRYEAAIRQPLMSGGSPRLLLGARDIGGIRHAESGADAVATIGVEILTSAAAEARRLAREGSDDPAVTS